jgi:hypothetical protein
MLEVNQNLAIHNQTPKNQPQTTNKKVMLQKQPQPHKTKNQSITKLSLDGYF